MNWFDLIWFVASLAIVVGLSVGVIYPNVKGMFRKDNYKTRTRR